MNDWSKFNPFRGIGAVVKSVKTDNALNPLLWLCVIGLVFASPLFYYGLTWFQQAIVAVLLLPVPAAIVAFFIFQFRDPDRLHSEKHQLALRQMDVMGDDLVGLPNTRNKTLVSNPRAKEINHEQ